MYVKIQHFILKHAQINQAIVITQLTSYRIRHFRHRLISLDVFPPSPTTDIQFKQYVGR